MKKGITVTMMVVVVLVMIILATAVTVTINSSIKYSRLSVWANEIGTIQDVVHETTLKKSAVDFMLDEVEFSTKGISTDILNEQFEGESITSNVITFNEIDLGKLEIANTVYGNKEEENDIYVYSASTGKVYYLAGIQDKYYTLTDDLSKRFNIESTNTKSSVVSFIPSIYGYTNKAISTVVKIPQEFTNITVTSSVSGMTSVSTGTVDGSICYKVNSEEQALNYNITVTYNNGKETITTTYMVNGYDNTKPVIEEIADDNLSYNVTDTTSKIRLQNVKATDTESGIENIWYIKGTLPEGTENVLEYFELHGTKIRKNKFSVDSLDTTYTICAKDRAGNFTYGECEISSGGWVQKSNRTVVKGDTVLNIGDYVNYVSDVDGYTDTNGWQVLGAENGELLLMSSRDITTRSFAETLDLAKSDYIYGKSELDLICEPYGKGTYAIGARSITVEDIDRVTLYDKTQYGKRELYEYGNTITYSYTGTEYPAYSGTNGVTGTLTTAHSSGFIWYDTTNGWQIIDEVKTGEICKVTSTYYEYEANETDLKSEGNTEKAYNMLFGSSNDNYYWLASSYVLANYEYDYYGLLNVVDAGVIGSDFVYSNITYHPHYTHGVRSVVRLSSYTNCTGSSSEGWTLSSDGWVQKSDRTVVKGNTVLNIGDYVNYVSGVEGYTDEKGWQVLGAENGELLLMSASSVGKQDFNSDLEFEEGKNVYLNSISTLNGLCKEYGNGEYATGARSITVEDIDRVTGYDKSTFGKGTISEYGNTILFSYNGTMYPAYSSSNGNSGKLTREHTDGFCWYDLNNVYHDVSASDLKSKNSGTIVKLLTTFYGYTASSNLQEKAYNMLFGANSDKSYWLASPFVNIRGDYVRFGIRRIIDGSLDGHDFVRSYWVGSGTSYDVYSVVTISADTSLTDLSNGNWKITGLESTSNMVSWKVLG